MKKSILILLSLILVLSIGQSTFADYELGLTAGYDTMTYLYSFYGNNNKERIDMTFLELNLGYEFYESYFLSFGERLSFGKHKFIEGNVFKIDSDVLELYCDLFIKKNIFSFENSRIGLQIGVMDDYVRLKTFFPMPDFARSNNMQVEVFRLNALFGAIGAYADLRVRPNMTIYGDLRIPILVMGNSALKDKLTNSGYAESQEFFGFFKSFLYDITLGFKYDIGSDIYLGVEGCITNSTIFDLENSFRKSNRFIFKETFPHVTIGATIGYRF